MNLRELLAALGYWLMSRTGRISANRVNADRTKARQGGRRVLQLFFCCSTWHLIANVADPALTGSAAIIVRSVHATHLRGLARRFQLPIIAPRGSVVAAILILWVLSGGVVNVWLPHLSPSDFPGHFLRSFLSSLEAQGVARFFDDGLGFFTRESHIYRQGWIARNATLHSWDYSLNEFMARECSRLRRRSSFARALALVQSHAPSLFQASGAEIPCCDAGARLNIFLASRCLDFSVCSPILRSINGPESTCYVPHYNVDKNDRRMMTRLPLLRFELPEFGLLAMAQRTSLRLYFGITSTAINLLELILRSDLGYRLECVFPIGTSPDHAANQDAMAFAALLGRYKKLELLSARGVDIRGL